MALMVLGAVNIDIDSKFLRKLLATTANGVGAVAGAWLKRRDAHANADVLRIEAQGQRDAEDILSGKKSLSKDGLLVEVASVLPILIDENVEHREIQARLIFQERKRQNNIRAIFDKAATYDEGEISDAPVNEDWVARYFTYAQDVSGEEMQDIWARILANEVRAPGSCSLRTLEKLKVLSAEDAKLFEKVRPYIVGDFIPSDKDFLASCGIYLDNIIKLDDAGLVNSIDGRYQGINSRKHHQDTKFAVLPLDSKSVIVAQHNQYKSYIKSLRIPAYSLTEAAREIDAILPPVQRDIASLKRLLEPYKKDSFTFHVAPFENGQVIIGTIKNFL